jgi:hypothetical protein
MTIETEVIVGGSGLIQGAVINRLKTIMGQFSPDSW